MNSIRFAGFGVRLIAFIIDFVLMLIPGFFLGVVTQGLGWVIFMFVYKAVWEASDAMATPGKRAMGIMVTSSTGERLTFKASLIRTGISLLSMSCAMLPHLIAFVTAKKQAGHDLLADSCVVEGETSAPLLDAWLKAAREILGYNETSGKKREDV